MRATIFAMMLGALIASGRPARAQDAQPTDVTATARNRVVTLLDLRAEDIAPFRMSRPRGSTRREYLSDATGAGKEIGPAAAARCIAAANCMATAPDERDPGTGYAITPIVAVWAFAFADDAACAAAIDYIRDERQVDHGLDDPRAPAIPRTLYRSGTMLIIIEWLFADATRPKGTKLLAALEARLAQATKIDLDVKPAK